MSKIIRRVAVVLAVLAPAGAARAEGVTPADPAPVVSRVVMSDKVPGTGDLTYLDLVRQIVPDIAPRSNSSMFEGHKVIDFRHLGGKQWQAKPPASVQIQTAEALPVRSDGQDRLALLVSLDQEGSGRGHELLALYSLGSTPTLVDAADVGFDGGTSFFDPGSLSLGKGKTALLTMSTGGHGGEDRQTTVLILLHQDRLQLVDTVATLSAVSCGIYMSNEVPEFRAGDDSGRAYPDIVAIVTQTIALNNSHTTYCAIYQPPPTPGTRVFSVTYSWDETASKYVPDPGAFDKQRGGDGDRL